jgi:hypothetical protein
MNLRAAVLAAAFALAGCTTNPIPQGYTGPLATIDDSAVTRSSTSADLFYVSDVDGRPIEDSRAATNRANSGRGFSLTAVPVSRQIPARPSRLTIMGETHYGAPIQAFLNPIYRVSGDVDFTPVPDRRYVVRGVLGPDYSGVWLEDADSHEVIGRKIEVHGSAAVGILEK